MLDIVFRELFSKQAYLNTLAGGDSFLTYLRSQFDLAHVAYLGVNIAIPGAPGHFAHNSYAPGFAQRYETASRISLGPMTQRGLTGLAPLEWQEPDCSGLGLPLRACGGETAVFCVTAALPPAAWQRFKARHGEDIRIAAAFFHQRVLERERPSPADTSHEHGLSHREAECLKWLGAGKSFWDIAVILGVSQRTVKFHAENARHKLDCLTNTQAVVTAMNRGLI